MVGTQPSGLVLIHDVGDFMDEIAELGNFKLERWLGSDLAAVHPVPFGSGSVMINASLVQREELDPRGPSSLGTSIWEIPVSISEEFDDAATDGSRVCVPRPAHDSVNGRNCEFDRTGASLAIISIHEAVDHRAGLGVVAGQGIV